MKLRRIFWSLVRIVALVIVSGGALLYFFQDKLIYYPHPYPTDKAELALTRGGGFAVVYQTSQGKQTAYYLPPAADGQRPEHLWVMFGGNGALATLNWGHLVLTNATANPSCSYLLIDYPGYGACEGKPSPAAIEESADAALSALRQKLNRPLPPLRVMGHSLGAAVALQFAAKHDTDRIILLAPFTSIGDMGRLMFGLRLDFLIRHNFDNRARLAELSRRPNPPRVIIFHGTDDQVIPQAMGRELAEQHPLTVTFHSLGGIGHNDVLEQLQLILPAMNAE